MKKILSFITAFMIAVTVCLPVGCYEAHAGTTTYIDNVTDLLNFANAVKSGDDFEGDTVILRSDIQDTRTLKNNGFISIGGGKNKAFCGTFDGQGHEIWYDISTSGNYYVGLFSYVKYGTVKNVSVEGTITATNSSSWVGGIAANIKQATIENCHSNVWIVDAGEYVGGIVGYDYSGPSTICYCSNKGNISAKCNTYAGGICGYLNDDSVINYCSNQGAVYSKNSSSDLGGIAGYCDTATIQNCVNGGCVDESSGSPTKRKGQLYARGDYKKLYNNYVRGDYSIQAVGDDSSFEYTKVSADSMLSGELCYMLNGYRTNKVIFYQNLDKPNKDYCPTLDSSHQIVTRDEETGTYKNITKSQATSKKSVVGIWNYHDLINFSEDIYNGEDFSGVTVKLKTDITIPTSYKFYSIGTSGKTTKPFRGTFDGGGYTITYTINGNKDSSYGLFGWADGATIKNVNVTGTIKLDASDAYVGSIAAKATCAKITGCTSNVNMTGEAGDNGNSYGDDEGHVGGILGYSDKDDTHDLPETVITNCTNNGKINIEAQFIGGIFGYAYLLNTENSDNAVTITNCKNTGTVSGGNIVGGIVAYTRRNMIISDSSNSGYVKGNSAAGGIIGRGSSLKITGCTNEAKATIEANYVGGIAGWTGVVSYATKDPEDYDIVEKCTNKGTVNGTSDAGGVSGISYGISVSECNNNGTINSSEGYAGGIVGTLYPGNIKGCENSGNGMGGMADIMVGGAQNNLTTSVASGSNVVSLVNGKTAAGGIVGREWCDSKANYINSCINRAVITSQGYCGGISGVSVDAKYTLCWNEGNLITAESTPGGIVGICSGDTQVLGCANKGKSNGSSSEILVGENSDDVYFGSGSNTGTVISNHSMIAVCIGAAAIALILIAAVSLSVKKKRRLKKQVQTETPATEESPEDTEADEEIDETEANVK